MRTRWAAIGTPPRDGHLVGEPLVLPAPKAFEGSARIIGCRVLIPEDGYPEPIRDPCTHRPGEIDASVHRAVVERDKRDDIDRPDSWMRAAVFAKVDAANGYGKEPQDGVPEGVRVADHREDGSVVRRVGAGVEQTNAGSGGYGVGELAEDVRAAAFADVGYGFDHGERRGESRISRSGPVDGPAPFPP